VQEAVVDAEEDAVLSVPVDSSQFEAADAPDGTEEDGDDASDTAAPVASKKPKKASVLKSKDKEKLAAKAASQLEAVRAEQAVSQRARLAYLLGDAHSDFFQHFLQHAAANSAGAPSAAASATSSKPGFGSPSRHRPEGAKPAEEAKAKGKASKGRGAAAAEEPADAEFELSAAPRLTRQPKCIMGAMRDYQLEGLNWMIGLHHNGLNGILADEMGLGKTLQTISLIAYCFEYQANLGPHIVLVPKSTLANWQKEFRRWCPVINTLLLQGEKDERAKIIHDHLQPGLAPSDRSWNVLLTTYEVAVIEKSALIKLPWQYLVIDEAHRIKNENSALAAVVRMFVTAHRLLITGTPLQNNLHELWALLNFLLPDVFSSSEAFDSWFNLTTQSKDEEAKAGMVKQLHRVLKPFMLRRLKVDVAKALPPKTETLLYVGFTRLQRELYRSILMRNMDAVLAERAGADKTRLANLLMHLRKACNHPYLMDGVEDRSLDPMGEHLIFNCAKLQLLDKLLPRLQTRGSRCLIFSQVCRPSTMYLHYFRALLTFSNADDDAAGYFGGLLPDSRVQVLPN
jgi:SWI/SNF-related matrix-associated actin-dependent regulator of chromatin subfamily A member 5